MQAKTKKFIKWLIISDVALIVIIIVLGAIFVKDHHYERGKMMGKAMGQFLLFSNIAAALIFKLRNKIKNQNKK